MQNLCSLLLSQFIPIICYLYILRFHYFLREPICLRMHLWRSMLALRMHSEFLFSIFPECILPFNTEQFSLKSTQVNVNKLVNITNAEIKQFIGIVILNSLVYLPSSRMYWSQNMGKHQVNSIMTCNNFDMMKRHLHFNNDFKPAGTQGHIQMFKIRPLIDKLRERLLLIGTQRRISGRRRANYNHESWSPTQTI